MNDVPPVCSCGVRTHFTGNETPDGKWVKDWKHHFKCPGCEKTFYQRSDRPFFILIGTEAVVEDDDED